MSRLGAIQVACLYGPLVGAALLAWQVRPTRWVAVGLLFSTAWVLAVLPWLDAVARAAGWWSYQPTTVDFAGMPLALFLGWGIAWGIFAPLLAQALGGRWWTVAAVLLLLDLRVMPELWPAVELRSGWLVGEMAVVAGLLVPSLFLSKWTTERSHLEGRCAMLAVAFGGIFLGIPLLALGGMEARWDGLAGWTQVGYLLGAAVGAVPGLTALRDLARSGGGTPVPLDPPQRLVRHGIYAFVRNPMQISMTALLLLEAAYSRSAWPAVLAGLGVIYSEGLARWSENVDMQARFGERWEEYRQEVRAWWPRWKPRVGEACELWVDAECGPCREVARWFKRREARGLEVRAAADFPGASLERVTWRHPASERTESGVRGIAMALQHVNLGWAMVGWFAGLPGVSWVLQICFDAAGAGKRGQDATTDERDGRR